MLSNPTSVPLSIVQEHHVGIINIFFIALHCIDNKLFDCHDETVFGAYNLPSYFHRLSSLGCKFEYIVINSPVPVA